jgi:hypothetical protein
MNRIGGSSRSFLAAESIMRAVACSAPTGPLEPAPITSLPLAADVGNGEVRAFWGDDDAYYVRAEAADGSAAAQWFRLESGLVVETGNLQERVAIARLMHDITPIGGGRVAFPVGSTGRRFYRVWRSSRSASSGRTRILAVRAGRSRRLPA